MALENMKSQFQPQSTTPSNGLAVNGGLENLAPNDSNLDLDDNPILSNALANNEGLESVTNQGSLLNIDEEPEEADDRNNEEESEEKSYRALYGDDL